MESVHFLNINFVQLRGGKSTGASEFNFFLNFHAGIFEFSLNPQKKLDGHRGTWTGFNHCLSLLSTLSFFFF